MPTRRPPRCPCPVILARPLARCSVARATVCPIITGRLHPAQARSKSHKPSRSRNPSANAHLPAQDFVFGETLGEGSYSTVRGTAPRSARSPRIYLNRLCLAHASCESLVRVWRLMSASLADESPTLSETTHSTMLSSPYVRDKVLKDYLASGGDDCRLVVWNVRNGAVACIIDTRYPVLSLTWDPRRHSTIFFGCENGVAAVLSDFEDPHSTHPIMTGTKAAVYCLDIDATSGKLAVGVGPEVHVAVALTHGRYATVDILPEPKQWQIASEEHPLLRPRTVHFLRGGKKLVVSYLSHGIVCWDVRTRTSLWQIEPTHSHRHIGFSALSPDQCYLLLSNLSTGADLYRLGQQIVIQSYPQVTNRTRNLPLVVSFLHKGQATICGATNGHVSIRHTWSGEHQQTLEHGGDFIQVLSVGNHLSTGFIATAASELGCETYIRIWKAELSPGIRDSFINTILTSMTFFYADIHEKSKILHLYGVVALLVIVIAWFYVWDMDGTMRLGQMTSDIVVSSAVTAWEGAASFCLNLWVAFLDWLRTRLRAWLFEGEILEIVQ